MPALWLFTGGCGSINRESAGQVADGTTTQIVSTNPVPVEVEDDHITIPAKLNGREVHLLLDTGASHLMILPKVAAAAGVKRIDPVRVAGFGSGRSSASRAVAGSLAVGSAVAENVPTAIMPAPPPFTADGMLGLSFLRHFIFRLDYQRKLVTLASIDATNLLSGNTSIMPLGSVGPMMTVEAKLDGIPAKLIVDTGAGQALILRSWFVEKQKLREKCPKRLDVVTGVGLLGKMHGEIARLQTVKLGDYTFTNVCAEFEPASKKWEGDFAGFVGAPILHKFTLTFDIAGHRLGIETNTSFAARVPPPATVRSGAVCLPEGPNWIVQDVVPDSPAAEAGVRLGDRVLEINGEPPESLKLGEIKKIFRAAPGTRVRLRLQTGTNPPRKVVLILRDIL